MSIKEMTNILIAIPAYGGVVQAECIMSLISVESGERMTKKRQTLYRPLHDFFTRDNVLSSREGKTDVLELSAMCLLRVAHRAGRAMGSAEDL